MLPDLPTFIEKTKELLLREFYLVEVELGMFTLSTPSKILLGDLRISPIWPNPVEKRYSHEGREYLIGPIGYCFDPVETIPSYNLGEFTSGLTQLKLTMMEVYQSFNSREFLLPGREPEVFLVFQQKLLQKFMEDFLPTSKCIRVGGVETFTPSLLLEKEREEMEKRIDQMGLEPDRPYTFHHPVRKTLRTYRATLVGSELEIIRLEIIRLE